MKAMTETLLGVRSGLDQEESEVSSAPHKVPLQTMQVISAWYEQQLVSTPAPASKSKKNASKRLASQARLDEGAMDRPPIVIIVRDFEAFDSKVIFFGFMISAEPHRSSVTS
jgi:hypothetical protein